MSAPLVFCRGGGKIRSVSLSAARVRARMFALDLHAKRQIVETLYAYECPSCKGWHLSRKNKDRRSFLVYEAASPEIQRWGWRR